MAPMIHSLQIGGLTFKGNLIQGPLAGTTCAPFRRLVPKSPAIAYTCSEMTSAQYLIDSPNIQKRHTSIDPHENPVCMQLSGTKAEFLAPAAKRLQDYGASLIDLNCGCPKPKIRKKNAGSRLLETPALLLQLIESIKNAIDIPLTVKIRLLPDVDIPTQVNLAQSIEQAGADALIVHARTYLDNYSILPNYEPIYAIKQACTIPIIGNGDVKDWHSAKQFFEKTQVDGLMISRFGVGQPHLFDTILAESQGKSIKPISSKQQGQLFLEHLAHLIELEGEQRAIYQSRKLVKYYTRSLPRRFEMMQKINQMECFKQVTQCIEQYCC